MNILQVNSSARAYTNGAGSFSTRLGDQLVQGLIAANPGASHTLRDLTSTPHPVLDEATLGALFTPAEARTPEQAARVALDDALIAEVLAADVLVLGAPMYNFGVSAQLKNWIDAISRARVTFQYTATGPVGLLKNKTAYVVTTRGGIHRGQASDTMVPYLKNVLAFLGITDVHVVYAEGLGMGPEAEARGIADAQAQIAALLHDDAVTA